MKNLLITILTIAVFLSFPLKELNGSQAESGFDPGRLELGNSRQVLVVLAQERGMSRAEAYAWEINAGGKWESSFGPLKAVIGRKGLAPAGDKREGDGRTPSGIFPLGFAFGYGPSAPTRLPYRRAESDSIWVDDASSPNYNRWTTRGATRASSFEFMKRKDGQYRFGVVIEYNMNPVISGRGSAIFLHVWRGPDKPTAGCVALSEPDVLKILGWLDPALNPVVFLGASCR
ncbi:MAG: L,D-transpeptidase family protein [Syntrophales bacterium]|nr:L,D-transpeptidase family protein [Syntrophales bacterium]MDD5533845.1 L,D-transpeptidase family protein [Syntrophales bacterium]